MKKNIFSYGFKFLAAAFMAVFMFIGCGSSSSSDTNMTTAVLPATKGLVYDSPIVGAAVCYDENHNNKCDGNETISTTNSKGEYFLEKTIPNLSLIAYGGNDTETLKPFTGIYKAPSGSSVLSPFSTLIEAGGNQDEIKRKYGIKDSVDLLKTSPSIYPRQTAKLAVYLKALKNVSGKTDDEVANIAKNNLGYTDSNIKDTLVALNVNDFNDNVSNVISNSITVIENASTENLFDAQKATEDVLLLRLKNFDDGKLSAVDLKSQVTTIALKSAITAEIAKDDAATNISSIIINDEIVDFNSNVFNKNPLNLSLLVVKNTSISDIRESLVFEAINDSNLSVFKKIITINFDSNGTMTSDDANITNNNIVFSLDKIPAGNYNFNAKFEVTQEKVFTRNVKLADHLVVKTSGDNNITVNSVSDFKYTVYSALTGTYLYPLLVESNNTSVARVTKVNDFYRITGVSKGFAKITATSAYVGSTVKNHTNIIIGMVTDNNTTTGTDNNTTTGTDNNTTTGTDNNTTTGTDNNTTTGTDNNTTTGTDNNTTTGTDNNTTTGTDSNITYTPITSSNFSNIGDGNITLSGLDINASVNITDQNLSGNKNIVHKFVNTNNETFVSKISYSTNADASNMILYYTGSDNNKSVIISNLDVTSMHANASIANIFIKYEIYKNGVLLNLNLVKVK
jgi:hypothetical protein